MFEQRKRKRNWNYTWVGIAGIVMILIAVIQIFRVNPPQRGVADAEPKIIWTDGEILKGIAEVPAGEFLSYPLNLNRKATFKVYYTTGKSEKKVAASVIKTNDFNMWKSGAEVPAVVATGYVPRGVITRVIEPGNYLFLLDNRNGSETIRLEEADVRVE